MLYMRARNSKQRRTLAAIFSDPVSATLQWAAIESLLVSVGCEVVEGNGSRVRFVKDGAVAAFHRPHPDREARRYQVQDTRAFFDQDRSSAVKAMTYKGYAARIEFDPDDEIFVGRIAGITDVVGFHADTTRNLIAAFREAVDDYVETCARIGKEPQKAFSGNLMLRIRPEVHANAAIAAEVSGKSLNQWSEEVLAAAARPAIPTRPS